MRAQDHAISSVKAKLQVRRLNFYYGRTQVLKNIELSIPERKITAFIGPSGCGKSTLLRTFNKMYTLDPKQDIALLRARIGMVFQKPTPFPMSVYDNIAFGMKLFERLSGAEMDARV